MNTTVKLANGIEVPIVTRRSELDCINVTQHHNSLDQEPARVSLNTSGGTVVYRLFYSTPLGVLTEAMPFLVHL